MTPVRYALDNRFARPQTTLRAVVEPASTSRPDSLFRMVSGVHVMPSRIRMVECREINVAGRVAMIRPNRRGTMEVSTGLAATTAIHGRAVPVSNGTLRTRRVKCHLSLAATTW